MFIQLSINQLINIVIQSCQRVQFKVDAVDRFRALEPVTAGVLFRHTSQRHTELGLSGRSIKEDV